MQILVVQDYNQAHLHSVLFHDKHHCDSISNDTVQCHNHVLSLQQMSDLLNREFYYVVYYILTINSKHFLVKYNINPTINLIG